MLTCALYGSARDKMVWGLKFFTLFSIYHVMTLLLTYPLQGSSTIALGFSVIITVSLSVRSVFMEKILLIPLSVQYTFLPIQS